MLIDHETAKNLELVRNALSYKSNQSLFGKCFSVFGLISLPMLTFRSNGRTAQSNFYKDGCTSVEKYNPPAKHRYRFCILRWTLLIMICSLAHPPDATVPQIVENRLDTVQGESAAPTSSLARLM
jgi:hypothetical protein